MNSSILNAEVDRTFDVVFTKGVLIHIAPEQLDQVYKRIHDFSSRYILIAEYYSPSPVSIDYRGYKEKLFKRDFAGELMDKYSDLKLIRNGFSYHRGKFPQDDLNWFLLEKTCGKK